MFPSPDGRLQSLIDWKFTLAEQGQVSRYGEYAGDFYKQYLPGGAPFPALHPPRKISKQVFDLAKSRNISAL